jgi:hypothetical protein
LKFKLINDKLSNHPPVNLSDCIWVFFSTFNGVPSALYTAANHSQRLLISFMFAALVIIQLPSPHDPLPPISYSRIQAYPPLLSRQLGYLSRERLPLLISPLRALTPSFLPPVGRLPFRGSLFLYFQKTIGSSSSYQNPSFNNPAMLLRLFIHHDKSFA